jgi:phosphoribosylformylglycinamidine synthase
MMTFEQLLHETLSLEAVACKDWLTNKVDRSVTGRVALQQCAGEIQLPLNNLGVMSMDYQGKRGIATSIGHAPGAALIDAAAGSRLAIAEALTNMVWAPIDGNLRGVSLSANWMWACRNEGEDARLYQAVQAASRFAIELGVNIPTGKDSLSMTQKYPDGEKVLAPGTVIISTVGEVTDIRQTASPVLKKDLTSELLYIDLSKSPKSLGGSSAAQVLNLTATGTQNDICNAAPDVADAAYFAKAFDAIQGLIENHLIMAGHDVSAGGLITTLLEMNFANASFGMELDLSGIAKDTTELFAENPAVVIQVANAVEVQNILHGQGITSQIIGTPIEKRIVRLFLHGQKYKLDIDALRDVWYKPSYLLDRQQSGEQKALERFENYKQQTLSFQFPKNFDGQFSTYRIDPHRKEKSGVRAAIIREAGVNGDREMAWALHLAHFDVKDIHITDLISGRENLEDVQMIVFVGGFANSDVFGSAKGWAGAFLFNTKAKAALDNFYARPGTLSLGVCNGCQLMMELGLITPNDSPQPKMRPNDSTKYESNFIAVAIPQNNSVMLSSLSQSQLGIWVAHGEGKFEFPKALSHYHVALRYAYPAYPANPNGSPQGIAGICSPCGRHLAMMPHLERAIYPWSWAYYPDERKSDEVSPWIEAFVNARKWIETNH